MQPDRDPHHILSLLHRATDAVAAELHRRLEAAGFGDIRQAHGCVFANVDRDGARLTDIAARAQITKQAVGEVVSELERLGYVERVPDPEDGRAKIVQLTERGNEAQETGFRIVAEIEAELAEHFGDEHVAALRAVLEQVVVERAPDPGRTPAPV